MSEFNFIISKILEKYPSISHEEEKILKEWLEESNNQEIFNSLTRSENKISMLERYDKMKQEEHQKWEEFQHDIKIITPQRQIFGWHNWYTYIAAASIVITILIGVKWVVNNDRKITKRSSVIGLSNDVKPGQFRAKLELSDGSILVLDSFSKGKLVHQGNSIVYNNGDQLIYKSKGRQKEDLYNTLTTAKGEIYSTVLSDGSKVWLNSQSSIRYPVTFNGNIRRVEISGEADFEVTPSFVQTGNGKMVKRQFIVSVNGMNVEVVGTHFSINAYNDEQEIKTSLVKGKVNVVMGTEKIALNPGQQVKLDKRTQKFEKLYDIDVEGAIAWRYGYFQFNNDDLKTVLRQIVRWYDVEVVYQGNIPEKRFWGKISRSNTLSEILKTLETNGIHFNIQGRRIIVL